MPNNNFLLTFFVMSSLTLTGCAPKTYESQYRDISGENRTDNQLKIEVGYCDMLADLGAHHRKCMLSRGFEYVRTEVID
jgi:hypothetical protein